MREPNVAQIFCRSTIWRCFSEIFFPADSESDDLERTQIHFQPSVAMPSHSLLLQRAYREVNNPPAAAFTEAETRRLRIRRDAESPRHVSVFAIQHSRGREHHARVIAGKKLQPCNLIGGHSRRKDPRWDDICHHLRHHARVEMAAAPARGCKLKCMTPELLRAGRVELGPRAAVARGQVGTREPPDASQQ